MADWRRESKVKNSNLKKEIDNRLDREEDLFYETTKKSKQEIQNLMSEARNQGFLVTDAEEVYRYLSIHEDYQNWEYHDGNQIRSHRVFTWTITDQVSGESLVIDLGVQNSYKIAQNTIKMFPRLGPNPYKYFDKEPSTDGKRVKEKILEWLSKIQ